MTLLPGLLVIACSAGFSASSLCHCSVARLCSTLCDPIDCTLAGFPDLHRLPEFSQTHVRWVSDAIPPSHPLSPPSPPALYLSQHKGVFQRVGCSHRVAEVLELQHQSFQWIFRTDFLYDGLVGSPCSPRDSQESSPAPQFKGINSLALRLLSVFYWFINCPVHSSWSNVFWKYSDTVSSFTQGAVILVVWHLSSPFLPLSEKLWSDPYLEPAI